MKLPAIKPNMLLIGAAAAFGLYMLARTADARKLVGGVVSGTLTGGWQAVQGVGYGVADAVGDVAGSVIQSATGKSGTQAVSDVLYGSILTPYGKAYSEWLKGGKRGKQPMPQDYPEQYSVWDRFTKGINVIY